MILEVKTRNALDVYALKIHHIRQKDKRGNTPTHGGATVVNLSEPYGRTLTGVSYCHINDPFDKKKGTVTAIHKILKKVYPGLFISHVISSNEGMHINLVEERFWLTQK